MKRKKSFSVFLFSVLFLPYCQNTFINSENHNVQVYFKYGHKNVLNTFENSYQKDLIMDGVIKDKFYFAPDEENLILNMANSINFFSLPDTFKYVKKVRGLILETDPNPGEQILRIKYLDKDKRIIWTYPINEDNPEVKNLIKLNNFIISIIESKPEYKKLPPTKGGYQ